jgi:hypothetical protein
MRTRVAFLFGTSLYAQAIRLRTGSPTHVELVLDDGSAITADCWAGVVRRPFVPGPKWRVLDLPHTMCPDRTHVAALDTFHVEQGAKYDWLGIFLSQAVKLNRQHPSRWFCSELVAHILKEGGGYLRHKPHQYSPAGLFRQLWPELQGS